MSEEIGDHLGPEVLVRVEIDRQDRSALQAIRPRSGARCASPWVPNA